MLTNAQLKALLAADPGALWSALAERSSAATEFDDLWFLTRLRARAKAAGSGRPDSEPLRLAVAGGYTTSPLTELLVHLLEMQGTEVELYVAEYDEYGPAIFSPESTLYRFEPQALLLLPSPRRARVRGGLADSREQLEAGSRAVSAEILDLCATFQRHAKADVVVANYPLPPGTDLGPARSKTLASTWSFRKEVNRELGLSAPGGVHLLDLEFLSCRLGTARAADPRRWFESKQPGSPEYLVAMAREAAAILLALRASDKKLLILDLDNTLWGGVIGDDGIAGIELGDTSPRGEAFKAFQRYVASLQERGLLLAVCSKNDHEIAEQAFREHPEMVLELDDIVSFKANWEPKSENIRAMADELGLGLDSFVFVDDNPAEIEIVRQFVPEVSTILLGDDPALHVDQLQDSGYFRRLAVTAGDSQRTSQYRVEAERRRSSGTITDMSAYLESLEMKATVSPFTEIDLPRITQLINKTNQFNLTTRRRTHAEVAKLMDDPAARSFTIRLSDRFGDHGLISVVICEVRARTLVIDTWLMSCRVLKRGVEGLAMNEIVRQACTAACATVRGRYRPTERNDMVRGLLPELGFSLVAEDAEGCDYALSVADWKPPSAFIAVHEEVR